MSYENPGELRVPVALCVGWDVGGWHGSKDGLAAVTLYDDGSVTRVGLGKRTGLGQLIAAGAITIDELLIMAGAHRPTPWPRIVLGVDAPLGLPTAFVQSTASRITDAVATFGELAPGVIENRLAYRDTERAIYAAFKPHLRAGWRPLSPSFDAMGSNISKARTAVSRIRALDPTRVRVIPFESDTQSVAIVEVYPALWNALRTNDLHPSLAVVLDEARTEPSEDARDGVLCAVSAACYESTRLELHARPRVMLPPSESDCIQAEGWIYAPLPTSSGVPVCP